MTKAFKNECIISFLISVTIISLAFVFAGVVSIAKRYLGRGMQFLDLTAALFDRLKNGENIFVTYSGGLGINLYAFAVYLLFCPLNILFLFFDKAYYQEVYLVITVIKFGIAAAGASFYLKHSRFTALSGSLNIAFALVYAFCEYNIHTVINIMWLDNTALLPLVLLGIEQAVDRRKIKLLFFSYLLCVLTNYYLAYITGLFAALYFVFYAFITYNNKTDIKNILKSLVLCAAAAICAFGICSFITLPAFVNISSGYSDTFSADITDKIFKYSPADIALFLTTYTHTASINGLNGFLGIAPIFITLLYFCDNNISNKERIAAFLFAAFMFLSLIFRPLYLVWHIFREPTGFFGRFLYTIAFLFIIFSARYVNKKPLPPKKSLFICVAFIIMLCALAFEKKLPSDGFKDILVNLTFSFVYMGIFLRTPRRTAFLFVILMCEALQLSFCGIHSLKKYNGWYERNSYTKHLKNTDELLSHINDSGFYRLTDVTNTDLNAALGIGYNSLETFSSQTNQKSLEKMSQLGIWCPYDHRVVNNYFNSVVSESLFNVKYIIASDKSLAVTDDLGRCFYLSNGETSSQRLASDNYKLVYENSEGRIYENTSVFPLMFSVNEAAVNSDTKFYNKNTTISGAYLNQAAFLNDMFGTDFKLYDQYTMQPPESSNAAIIKNGGEWDYFTVLSKNGPGYAGYTFTAPANGEYCIDARIKYPASFIYAANAFPLECAFSNNSQMLNTDIGPYKKGDTINIILQANGAVETIQPLLLHLREDEFKKLSDKANENALLNINLGKNGTINATSNFNEERSIFCSLSYDEGTHIYIDGAETQKIKIADAFLGFKLPAGEHKITIKYISPGFWTGIFVSLVFALFSAVLLIYDTKKRGRI